jgi:hypothetical protein
VIIFGDGFTDSDRVSMRRAVRVLAGRGEYVIMHGYKFDYHDHYVWRPDFDQWAWTKPRA